MNTNFDDLEKKMDAHCKQFNAMCNGCPYKEDKDVCETLLAFDIGKAEGVDQAEWIDEKIHFKCSRCSAIHRKRTLFCEECGAKMINGIRWGNENG